MLACIFIIVGVVLVFKGIESFSVTMDFLAGSTRVPGTVVGFAEKPFIPSIVGQVIIFYPIIQFSDSSGNLRRNTSHLGTRWKFYVRGESVEVILNPQHPETVVISSFLEVWSKSFALLILGIPMLFGGAISLCRLMRQHV